MQSIPPQMEDTAWRARGHNWLEAWHKTPPFSVECQSPVRYPDQKETKIFVRARLQFWEFGNFLRRWHILVLRGSTKTRRSRGAGFRRSRACLTLPRRVGSAAPLPRVLSTAEPIDLQLRGCAALGPPSPPALKGILILW